MAVAIYKHFVLKYLRRQKIVARLCTIKRSVTIKKNLLCYR